MPLHLRWGQGGGHQGHGRNLTSPWAANVGLVGGPLLLWFDLQESAQHRKGLGVLMFRPYSVQKQERQLMQFANMGLGGGATAVV